MGTWRDRFAIRLGDPRDRLTRSFALLPPNRSKSLNCRWSVCHNYFVTKRAALFSLCCRFDAHNRVTAGRAALRKFPTFERPQAKLPFEKRLLARVLSWPSPPSRNAHAHSHRNLEPITRFVPLEAFHLGRRNLHAVPFTSCPMTMTAARQYH